MSYVSVQNLHVYYGKLHAVRGVSFDIPKGEVFGFIGPNGAGKSSTIKVLGTLMKPHTGTAMIDGIDIPKNPYVIRRRIGFMPDYFGVYPDLTVHDYLHFFAAAFHLPIRSRERTIGDVLALTDLTGKRDAEVDSLSRGMKQRLGIARVLLHDPDVLLLDEPASGLDPRARIEMRELLKELRRLGKTILISSHILHELAQLCTSVGIIEAGELIVHGTLDHIYKQLGLLRIIHVQVTNIGQMNLDQIRTLPGVQEVEQQADRLALKVHEDQTTPEDLLGRMIAVGCRVRMFQPEAMDIETAFMKLTKGKTA
jgi:ABC-2 type transport system ATP-binding protein